MNSALEIPSTNLSNVSSLFPCRERQIQALKTLISINGASNRNIIVHGLAATGKTVITKAILEEVARFYQSGCDRDESTSSVKSDNSKYDNIPQDIFSYAFVNNEECIDVRQLFEHTIGSICHALNVENNNSGLLANISDFLVQIQKLLESWVGDRKNVYMEKRFILVLDGIDKQIRNGFFPQSLPAALTRIGDFVPNLTIVYITTYPRTSFLNFPGIPCIFFQSYTKSELLKIILLTKPIPPLSSPEDTFQIWSRFTSSVYDSLSKHSGRDLLSFRTLCLRLWPVFIHPILSDEIDVNSFSRLMVVNRSLFQNDYVLVHDIISPSSKVNNQTNEITAIINQKSQHTSIADLLPTYSRLLLIACYIASFSPVRNDTVTFTKSSTAKRRRKGYGLASTSSASGVVKSRKIPRKLLGAQGFVLERMLAIFHALCADSDFIVESDEKNFLNNHEAIHSQLVINGNANVQTAIATLVSLRLLTRTGNPNISDILDASIKYRVTIGWDMVRSLARSVGIEIENYLGD
ncbi:putative origin recognition complex subunit orc5 [Erysiphe necator]|uniref:Putative origin recognition complex subunit orc5 n=1 Tax=Uncinula necator TaxID=52586 RepID=A0A0B1P816_UNCNE|nr:putative origin recognition complex subunit orc5 [Erysiphe necator]